MATKFLKYQGKLIRLAEMRHVEKYWRYDEESMEHWYGIEFNPSNEGLDVSEKQNIKFEWLDEDYRDLEWETLIMLLEDVEWIEIIHAE